jgi:hypothetical protein
MSGYVTSKLAGNKLFDHIQAENSDLHAVSIQPATIDTYTNNIRGLPSLDTGRYADMTSKWY